MPQRLFRSLGFNELVKEKKHIRSGFLIEISTAARFGGFLGLFRIASPRTTVGTTTMMS